MGKLATKLHTLGNGMSVLLQSLKCLTRMASIHSLVICNMQTVTAAQRRRSKLWVPLMFVKADSLIFGNRTEKDFARLNLQELLMKKSSFWRSRLMSLKIITQKIRYFCSIPPIFFIRPFKFLRHG